MHTLLAYPVVSAFKRSTAFHQSALTTNKFGLFSLDPKFNNALEAGGVHSSASRIMHNALFYTILNN